MLQSCVAVSSVDASRLLGSSAVSTEEIRSLIAQKERELHDINEFRQQSLETTVAALVREDVRSYSIDHLYERTFDL